MKTNYSLLGAGIELLRQEYLWQCAALREDSSFTKAERKEAKAILDAEHKRCCTEEWKAITAHGRERNGWRSGEARRREVSHEEAWERFMRAERRDLENRRSGHLRKMLGAPLPGEYPEELERLASEDEARAEEGLVGLKNREGEVYYKHIDALSPEDRQDRMESEWTLAEWIAERTHT